MSIDEILCLSAYVDHITSAPGDEKVLYAADFTGC